MLASPDLRTAVNAAIDPEWLQQTGFQLLQERDSLPCYRRPLMRSEQCYLEVMPIPDIPDNWWATLVWKHTLASSLIPRLFTQRAELTALLQALRGDVADAC